VMEGNLVRLPTHTHSSDRRSAIAGFANIGFTLQAYGIEDATLTAAALGTSAQEIAAALEWTRHFTSSTKAAHCPATVAPFTRPSLHTHRPRLAKDIRGRGGTWTAPPTLR